MPIRCTWRLAGLLSGPSFLPGLVSRPGLRGLGSVIRKIRCGHSRLTGDDVGGRRAWRVSRPPPRGIPGTKRIAAFSACQSTRGFTSIFSPDPVPSSRFPEYPTTTRPSAQFDLLTPKASSQSATVAGGRCIRRLSNGGDRSRILFHPGPLGSTAHKTCLTAPVHLNPGSSHHSADSDVRRCVA